MAQSDQVVQNATFPSVRADINDNLAALYSQSSGNTAPTVTVAFQPWVDTSSSPPVKKIRNGSNSAWITEGVLDPAAFQVGGITQIANGGTGATTATAGLAALLPSQTGNAGKALVTDGSAASWTTVSGITSSTAVASTSGTSIDFISIPAGVKRVTVLFNEVSLSGTSGYLVQIGTSSGIVSSGYVSVSNHYNTSNQTSGGSSTSGFYIHEPTAANLMSGKATIETMGSNMWIFSDNVKNGPSIVGNGAGSKTLSGTLDRVRITTVNGTDTFDAGLINILYET
jgi:hypothetical protein